MLNVVALREDRKVNVTATSAELIGLRPESTYTISVRAYTAAGPREERRLTVVHTKK